MHAIYVGRLPCGCIGAGWVDVGQDRKLLAQNIGDMALSGHTIERVVSDSVRVTGCQCAAKPDWRERLKAEGWIHCDERMPKPDVNVETRTTTGEIADGFWADKDNKHFWLTFPKGYSPGVTWWRPLKNAEENDDAG